MVLNKIHLQNIPFVKGTNHSIFVHLLVKHVGNGDKVRSSEVIQVGITYNFSRRFFGLGGSLVDMIACGFHLSGRGRVPVVGRISLASFITPILLVGGAITRWAWRHKQGHGSGVGADPLANAFCTPNQLNLGVHIHRNA